MNMSCLIILKKILSYFPKKCWWNWMELDGIGCLENPRWALPIEATTLLRFGRSTFPLRFRIVKRCQGASFLRAQRNFIRKTKENIQKLCLRLESANLLNVWCLGWNFSFAMLCWSVGCQKKNALTCLQLTLQHLKARVAVKCLKLAPTHISACSCCRLEPPSWHQPSVSSPDCCLYML